MQENGFPIVCKTGGGGLAVYAFRRILPGETVLLERPLVLTVAHVNRPRYCANCLADCQAASPSMPAWPTRCEQCSTQYYCCAECRAAAAPRHSGVECAALAASANEMLDQDDVDTVAQAIRILADRANGRELDIGCAGTFGGLTAYAQRLVGVTPSTEDARAALDRSVTATLKVLPEAARVSPAVLLDLLERHGCNLYGCSGVGGEEVACASFVGLFHLLNHACCPNVVFDSARPAAPATADGAPPTFALRALELIEQGQEVNISYVSSAEVAVAPNSRSRKQPRARLLMRLSPAAGTGRATGAPARVLWLRVRLRALLLRRGPRARSVRQVRRDAVRVRSRLRLGARRAHERGRRHAALCALRRAVGGMRRRVLLRRKDSVLTLLMLHTRTHTCSGESPRTLRKNRLDGSAGLRRSCCAPALRQGTGSSGPPTWPPTPGAWTRTRRASAQQRRAGPRWPPRRRGRRPGS